MTLRVGTLPLNAIRISLIVFVFALCALAAKQFTMPHPNPARTYPAHDEHPTEHVTIAVDPYDTTAKEDPVFSVNYIEHGFYPMHFIVTNDGSGVVSLINMKVELVTHNRTKIQPASNDDVFRRLTNLKRPGPRTLPIPIPSTRARGGIPKEAYDELGQAQFAAKAVEPHNTQSGFYFFDISGISNPLAGAHLYVTGVKDDNGNELMYFEIPLEKYLSAPPAPSSAPGK